MLLSEQKYTCAQSLEDRTLSLILKAGPRNCGAQLQLGWRGPLL